MTHSKLTEVYLGIGSNIGNRLDNITKAYFYLNNILSSLLMASIYKTKPLHITNQPEFLNTIVSGTVNINPFQLLDKIHEIENKLGRDRQKEIIMGPRKIDIDILLYGSEIIKSDVLICPHSKIKERQFVLIPLIELSPDLMDPLTNISYKEYLKRLKPQGVYLFSNNVYSTVLKKK